MPKKVVTIGGSGSGGFDKPLNDGFPPYPLDDSVRHVVATQRDKNTGEQVAVVDTIETPAYAKGEEVPHWRWKFVCDDPRYPDLEGKVAYMKYKASITTHLRNKNTQLYIAIVGRAPSEGDQIDFDQFVGKHVNLRFDAITPKNPQNYANGVIEVIKDVEFAGTFGAAEAPVTAPQVPQAHGGGTPPPPPVKDDSSGLPPGWRTATDPASGKTYYINPDGQTQWESPVPASILGKSFS